MIAIGICLSVPVEQGRSMMGAAIVLANGFTRHAPWPGERCPRDKDVPSGQGPLANCPEALPDPRHGIQRGMRKGGAGKQRGYDERTKHHEGLGVPC